MYSDRNSFSIKSAWTRSVVEEFEKMIESIDPALKWELQSADGLSDGWYLLKYLTIPKSQQYQYAGVKYKSVSYLARKRQDGVWDTMEV